MKPLRNRSFSWLLTSLCAVTITPLLPLRAADAAAPDPDALIESWIKATGGRSVLEKVQSRSGKGTLEMTGMGVTAAIEFKAKAPNKRASKVEVAGFGTVREGFDGKVGWALNPGTAVVEKTGAELTRVARDAEFQRELKFRRIYPKLQVKGSAKVGDRDAWVLEATPKDGDPDTFYFDRETGLLLRQDGETETPNGKAKIEIYLEDYRSVDGAKQPFKVRVKQAEVGFVILFTEMKTNETIPDTEFAKPAS